MDLINVMVGLPWPIILAIYDDDYNTHKKTWSDKSHIMVFGQFMQRQTTSHTFVHHATYITKKLIESRIIVILTMTLSQCFHTWLQLLFSKVPYFEPQCNECAM